MTLKVNRCPLSFKYNLSLYEIDRTKPFVIHLEFLCLCLLNLTLR